MNWYVALFIGYVLGIICVLIKSAMKKPDGVFRIDLSDPMDESLKLELLKPLSRVINESYIFFKVEVINDESREKQRL